MSTFFRSRRRHSCSMPMSSQYFRCLLIASIILFFSLNILSKATAVKIKEKKTKSSSLLLQLNRILLEQSEKVDDALFKLVIPEGYTEMKAPKPSGID